MHGISGIFLLQYLQNVTQRICCFFMKQFFHVKKNMSKFEIHIMILVLNSFVFKFKNSKHTNKEETFS